MLGKHRRVRESKNPQNVIRVALTENYGEIGKVLVNLLLFKAWELELCETRDIDKIIAKWYIYIIL